jgi:SSS family solute:Na+ symporter
MHELEGIKLPDYLVIIAYFILIVMIGYYFKRYIKQAKDYFAAGNVMPWWIAGTSFFMASFSTLLFVIYSEISYKYGTVGIIITWIGPICILLGGYFTAHRWRRARILTPLGFMERRYSSTVHQIFVWTGFPLRMFDNALKIFSTAIVITVALKGSGISLIQFMVIVGVIMIAYSFLGGQMTVMITDFVQAVVLAVAVVFLFVLTLNFVFTDFGSLGSFIAKLPDGFLNPIREPYGWSYLIFTVFLITLLTYNASWALVQKYNTVRDEKDARKMVYLIAFLMFISPPIFFFPGIAARLILPNLSEAKEVYAAITLKILPVGMMGFILVALLSATLSTLGSEFNTLSGILTRDFYKRKINPAISEQKEVLLGRLATVIIGSLTILIAIVLSFFQGLTLMDIMFRFFTAFGPPIMIPLILGLLFKKFNARGVIWGVIAGAATGVILVLANFILVGIYSEQMSSNATVEFWLRSGWNSAATVLNILATVFGMWLGTVTKATPKEEHSRVEAFFDDLTRPFELDAEAKASPLSPFKIIGYTLAAFGFIFILIAFLVLLVYHNKHAFWLDMALSVVLILLGLLMGLWPGRNGRMGN